MGSVITGAAGRNVFLQSLFDINRQRDITIMGKDRDLAAAHSEWLMNVIRGMTDAILDAMEPIMTDVMEHGIKHGRELEREENKNGKT